MVARQAFMVGDHFKFPFGQGLHVGEVGIIDAIARSIRCAGEIVLGGVEQLPRLKDLGIDSVAMGIGDNTARQSLARLSQESGFNLPSLVHPEAIVSRDVELGEGVVIAAGAIINPACRIGDNVLINTAASIDHESIISSGAHVAPGVRMAGRVCVGQGAFVGVGSVVIDNVRIGAGAIIGAGSLVLQDVPDGAVVYGAPAKVIRQVEG